MGTLDVTALVETVEIKFFEPIDELVKLVSIELNENDKTRAVDIPERIDEKYERLAVKLDFNDREDEMVAVENKFNGRYDDVLAVGISDLIDKYDNGLTVVFNLLNGKDGELLTVEISGLGKE